MTSWGQRDRRDWRSCQLMWEVRLQTQWIGRNKGMWQLLHPSVWPWRSEDLHVKCRRYNMAGEPRRGHFNLVSVPLWKLLKGPAHQREEVRRDGDTSLQSLEQHMLSQEPPQHWVSFRINHSESPLKDAPTPWEGKRIHWHTFRHNSDSFRFVYKRLVWKQCAAHDPLTP